MVDFSLPSGKNACLINNEVRLSLYESLIWCAKHEQFISLSPPLNNWYARPVDFGWYYDILVSLNDAQPTKHKDTLTYLNESFHSQASKSSISDKKLLGLKITTLSPPWFNPKEVDCIVRWLDIEPENGLSLMALDNTELDKAAENLHIAMKVIQTLLPDFMEEMLGITSEIIFAKPSGHEKMTFGGASSFSLWGALALNSQAHPDWWLYIPRLIHEYSHNLLFGIARNEPLLLNDPDEVYYSPLRQELRPIDGIYHAAFVSAREALAMREILSQPHDKKMHFGFDGLDAYCKQTLVDSTVSFKDCLSVIQQHGRLTQLGSIVLGDIVNAMNESNI